jgi:hypothetical protein
MAESESLLRAFIIISLMIFVELARRRHPRARIRASLLKIQGH